MKSLDEKADSMKDASKPKIASAKSGKAFFLTDDALRKKLYLVTQDVMLK